MVSKFYKLTARCQDDFEELREDLQRKSTIFFVLKLPTCKVTLVQLPTEHENWGKRCWKLYADL